MSNTREAAKRAVANMNAARNFPVGTCPASRHVAVMAETLAKRKTYYMLTEEPDHCAESMATIVGALWECRAERDALAEKLARAVEAAFYEGFYEGNEGGRVSPAWKQSDALAELKGQNDE